MKKVARIYMFRRFQYRLFGNKTSHRRFPRSKNTQAKPPSGHALSPSSENNTSPSVRGVRYPAPARSPFPKKKQARSKDRGLARGTPPSPRRCGWEEGSPPPLGRRKRTPARFCAGVPLETFCFTDLVDTDVYSPPLHSTPSVPLPAPTWFPNWFCH